MLSSHNQTIKTISASTAIDTSRPSRSSSTGGSNINMAVRAAEPRGINNPAGSGDPSSPSPSPSSVPSLGNDSSDDPAATPASSSSAPASTASDTTATKKKNGKNDDDGPTTVRINVRYRNSAGRSLVLTKCLEVHYDFGPFNSTLNVALRPEDISRLASDPNIERCDANSDDGAVRYCYVTSKRSSLG